MGRPASGVHTAGAEPELVPLLLPKPVPLGVYDTSVLPEILEALYLKTSVPLEILSHQIIHLPCLHTPGVLKRWDHPVPFVPGCEQREGRSKRVVPCDQQHWPGSQHRCVTGTDHRDTGWGCPSTGNQRVAQTCVFSSVIGPNMNPRSQDETDKLWQQIPKCCPLKSSSQTCKPPVDSDTELSQKDLRRAMISGCPTVGFRDKYIDQIFFLFWNKGQGR